MLHNWVISFVWTGWEAVDRAELAEHRPPPPPHWARAYGVSMAVALCFWVFVQYPAERMPPDAKVVERPGGGVFGPHFCCALKGC